MHNLQIRPSTNTTDTIIELSESLKKCRITYTDAEKVDWVNQDDPEIGHDILSIDEIVETVRQNADAYNNEPTTSEPIDIEEALPNNQSAKEALKTFDTFLQWSLKNCSEINPSILYNIKSVVEKKCVEEI